MNPQERIIVAVDVERIDEAVMETVRALAPHVGLFKIGLELIMAGEADKAVRAVGDPTKVMFDAKLHDIPHTVGKTVGRIAAKDVGMFTVHASGGVRMVEAAVRERGDSHPLVVTVLTSLDEKECERVYHANPAEQVENLAMLAIEAGAEHLVCSAADIPSVRRAEKLMHRPIMKVTPGVRVDWGEGQQADDQRRILTPRQAVFAGADYLVIGRDIMQAERRHGISPLEAARRIAEEMASVLKDNHACVVPR